MTKVARSVRWQGVGAYRDEAEPLLAAPGDIAGVVRGRPRSVVIACPDGCGDTLVINLDQRAGKAWALDLRRGVTLYPSVWRENGCRSHFIVWRDHIVWCGRFTDDNVEPPYDYKLENAVLGSLGQNYRDGCQIAIELGEVTWDVLRVLRKIAHDGRAEEGKGPDRERYRLSGGAAAT